MTDYDGRELEVVALQHQHYEAPDLRKQSDERYWNFLEAEFDPREADAKIGLQIRRVDDVPNTAPRGGGVVRARASETARPHDCKLPPLKTLPNAEVRFTTLDGRPIRGARSLADGAVPVAGLVGVARSTKLLLTAFDGEQALTQIVDTA